MRLRQAGFLVIVVTNQPDVGAGRVAREVVEAMHDVLRKKVTIDAIEVCYHVASDNCDCRKPRAGMITRAIALFSIDPSRSWMVGDRASDIAAGKLAACGTVFIDLGYTAEARPVGPDHVATSLAEATSYILSSSVSGSTQ